MLPGISYNVVDQFPLCIDDLFHLGLQFQELLVLSPWDGSGYDQWGTCIIHQD